MTFIPDARLESRAATLWRTHALLPGFDIEALVDKLQLGVLWEALPEAPQTVVLGALQPEGPRIVINERHRERFDANPGLLRFTYAHEVGHWLFHCEDARAGNLAMFENGRIWCRDGSADPTEIQANRFASFLLVPTDRLRPLLPSVPWSGWPHVYKLAEHFAVSPTAMIVRLEQGGWGARDEAGMPSSLVQRARDDSQLQLPM